MTAHDRLPSRMRGVADGAQRQRPGVGKSRQNQARHEPLWKSALAVLLWLLIGTFLFILAGWGG